MSGSKTQKRSPWRSFLHAFFGVTRSFLFWISLPLPRQSRWNRRRDGRSPFSTTPYSIGDTQSAARSETSSSCDEAPLIRAETTSTRARCILVACGDDFVVCRGFLVAAEKTPRVTEPLFRAEKTSSCAEAPSVFGRRRLRRVRRLPSFRAETSSSCEEAPSLRAETDPWCTALLRRVRKWIRGVRVLLRRVRKRARRGSRGKRRGTLGSRTPPKGLILPRNCSTSRAKREDARGRGGAQCPAVPLDQMALPA